MANEQETPETNDGETDSSRPLAAMLAANAVTVLFIGLLLPIGESGMMLMFALGVLYAQVMLLALWSALGAQRGLTRIAGSLALLMLLMAAVEMLAYRDTGDWSAAVPVAVIMLPLWLLGQSPFWLMRLAVGLRIERQGSRRSAGLAQERQFRLGQALGLMAVVGVVAGLIRLAATSGVFRDFATERRMIAELAIVVGLGLLVGVGGSYAALARRGAATLLLAGAVVSGFAVGLSFSAIHRMASTPGEVLGYLAMLFVAEYAWLVGCLLVVRRAGYRLRRYHQAGSSDAGATPGTS